MAGRDTAQHCPVCWAHLSQTPQTLAQSHFSHTTLLGQPNDPALLRFFCVAVGLFLGTFPLPHRFRHCLSPQPGSSPPSLFSPSTVSFADSTVSAL